MSGPLASLVKKIDQQLIRATRTGARAPGAFVIFINNGDSLDHKLRQMAEKEGLKRVNLCIGAPPADYALANEADVTVVIYNVKRRREQHVTANFALRKGELDAAKTDNIVKALSAVLSLVVQTLVPTSKENEQLWNFAMDNPAAGWLKPDFDDSHWKSGPGGFGTNASRNCRSEQVLLTVLRDW